MLVKRRPLRTPKKEHPTKRALIDTVVGMLETTPVESVTCDAVLDASGISRGSLYYHFTDFGDLIEHALAFRFSRFVDETVTLLNETVSGSTSASEFRGTWLAFAHALHDPHGAQMRFERTVPYAAAANSERFRKMLGVEQQRLTDGYADVIRSAQGRGWMSTDLDPQVIAVLFQAIALGSVVDDLAENRATDDAWNQAIGVLLDRIVVPA